MEPVGSIFCSQGPFTDPYPETDEPCPYPLTIFLYDPSYSVDRQLPEGNTNHNKLHAEEYKIMSCSPLNVNRQDQSMVNIVSLAFTLVSCLPYYSTLKI
jgi:hypothetical protein